MTIGPIAITAVVFLLFYVAILTEEWHHANRVVLALTGAVTLWVLGLFGSLWASGAANPLGLLSAGAVQGLGGIESLDTSLQALKDTAYRTSQIILFLLSVMMLVEWIRQNQGFEILRAWLMHDSALQEAWRLTWVTFILSAIIDNMTATLVMLAIIKGRYLEPQRQWSLVSLVVLASNAGGAWSAIGDVTTTMLWIEGKVTAWGLLKAGILPALLNCLLPFLLCMPMFKGVEASHRRNALVGTTTPIFGGVLHSQAAWVLLVGLGLMVMLPLVSHLLDLAPALLALMSLVLVVVLFDPLLTLFERIRFKGTKGLKGLKGPRFITHKGIHYTFLNLDWSSVFFIFGILMCMGALEASGVLAQLSIQMNKYLGNAFNQVFCLGLFSAFLDNIPLVSASLGIYDPKLYPIDHPLWLFLAYGAGTGGSLLILGSAAGIVAMGQEGLKFNWYLRNFSGKALWGYLAGACVFWLMR